MKRPSAESLKDLSKEQLIDLVLELFERVGKLSGQNAALMAQNAALMKRVEVLEGLDPLMAAGNWIPELVAMAGGDNLFGVAGQHSPWLAWEALIACDPDVLVILPCGYDFATTYRELPALTSHPAWPQLRAVKESQVFITGGNQYFNRPGPRLDESLEILAEIFHPEQFHFGHEGTGWQRL